MSQELLTETRAHVMWVTINRPERRNAITLDLLRDISAAIERANDDRSVRAIVLTGVGDQAFCAGADLQTGKPFAFDYSEPHSAFANVFRSARRSTVPLIARVNGTCLASGMGLLSMCDMAVSAEHARYGLPEVKVGLFPAQVTTLLQHLIGRRKLAELCITGESIDAREALAIGLVNQIGPDVDQLLDALLARTLDKSPSAIRRGLYLMKTIDAMAFEEAMAFTESQVALFALTEDAKEGQAASRENRKPVWTGR